MLGFMSIRRQAPRRGRQRIIAVETHRAHQREPEAERQADESDAWWRDTEMSGICSVVSWPRR
jgi:hypothetical protein